MDNQEKSMGAKCCLKSLRKQKESGKNAPTGYLEKKVNMRIQ